jgi:hypothetical protein
MEPPNHRHDIEPKYFHPGKSNPLAGVFFFRMTMTHGSLLLLRREEAKYKCRRSALILR